MGQDLMTERATTPRAVVEHVVAAIKAGQIERIGELVGDDVTWHALGADYMPNGCRFEGRRAVIEDFLVGTVLSAFDFSVPIELDVTGIYVDGATVVVEWSVRARTRHGRDYANDYCVVFEVRDGAIQTVREYFDTGYAKRVLFD